MDNPPPRPDFRFLLSALLAVVGLVLMMVGICLDRAALLVPAMISGLIGFFTIKRVERSQTPKIVLDSECRWICTCGKKNLVGCRCSVCGKEMGS